MQSEPTTVSRTASESSLNSQDELPYRRRQQALLREFGSAALQTRDIGLILQLATELCARGLQCSYAKALEYLPDEKRLIVRAGIGWPPGTVDHVSLGTDIEKGKLTLPLIHFLKHAAPQHRELLLGLLESREHDRVERVRQLVAPSESIAYARHEAERLVTEAVNALSVLPASEARQSLIAAAHYVTARDK